MIYIILNVIWCLILTSNISVNYVHIFFLKLNKIIIFVLSLLSLSSILLLMIVYYHIFIRLLFILTKCSQSLKRITKRNKNKKKNQKKHEENAGKSSSEQKVNLEKGDHFL